MTELQNLVWVEKWRPKCFEDLILENKHTLLNCFKNSKSIPSFIFYSSKPGTGKTSAAKIIIRYLDSDYLIINSSDERGIDVIREKIKLFASSMSSNPDLKRCIFMDEFDGCTRQAQDSLRNLMETYSDNCFFIFSCNDISKIIEPIQSRCITINFEKPNKIDIICRLNFICEHEQISIPEPEITKLVDTSYPDMRSMIKKLQRYKMSGCKEPLNFDEEAFISFLEHIKTKNVEKIYETVYSGNFEIMEFNKWLFNRLFMNYKNIGLEKASKIALCLADTEKSWNIGANIEIVFISNVLEIMKIL